MEFNRIFISGGAGVIGSSLVSKLLAQGKELFVGDLKPCPSKWEGQLLYREGDLNGLKASELQDFNPDLYIHLAATFERTEEQPEFFKESFRHNTLLSHHLLACAVKCPNLHRILFASSYLVYDPSLYLSQTLNPATPPLNENDPIRPRNLCGGAKLFHEQELEFFRERFTSTFARIYRVYGKGSADVIGRWIRSALKGESIKLYSPQGRFDYIYADDVAEGLIRLAKTSYQGAVNLGTGNAYAVGDIVGILKSHFTDLHVKEEECNMPIENSSADVQRLKELIPFDFCRPPEIAIPEVITYQKTCISSRNAL